MRAMIPIPTHPIRALLPNTEGEDYLVGDIHGHFNRLEAALADKNFNPACDRLISVGDLVDRGHQNAEAADWLAKPWFHAIRGNHEDMYLTWRSLRGCRADQDNYEELGYRKNGGNWMHEVDEAGHQRLEASLHPLPYFLLLPVGGRTIGVIHAELPDNFRWPDCLNQAFQADWITPMTWGRTVWKSWRKQEKNEPWFEGLDAVVAGHTPVPSPQVWGNTLLLDTGGWRKKGQFFVVRSVDVLNWVDGTAEPPGRRFPRR